jgi:predicted aspartyl protease/cytochrome c-type biogenesis protein CcmH/NrfG
MRLGIRTRALLSVTALLTALPLVVGTQGVPPSDNVEIQLQLGALLYSEARYSEALDAFQRAEPRAQGEARQSARMGVVRSALRVAEFTLARDVATSLKTELPANPEVISLYGDALWATGLFEDAERTYRDALAIDAAQSRARHGLARALASRNRLEEALDQAQSALRESPRDPEYHHTVGMIYERMHKFEEAAISIGNYVNLLPNKDRSDRAAWSRAEVRFLRSFGNRVPFQIDAAARQRLYTVPFRLVDDKVIIRAKFNNSPDMDFVVDTGAEQTVVSQGNASRYGAAPVVYTISAGVGDVGLRTLQVGRLESLTIGDLKISNVPCLIKNPPLHDLPTREGESLSPLALGLSMSIDYKRRELTIGRQEPMPNAEYELPMHVYRLATVRGTVDNHPANFVVDTGGEVISISSSTANGLKRPQTVRRIPLKVYGTSGWDRDAYLLPGVDLVFDAIKFPNLAVVVLNLQAPSALLGYQVGGIIGHKFLSKYKVQIDLEQSVLRLNRL